MVFFEKYLSPGACKCLPPRGGVGDHNSGGTGRGVGGGILSSGRCEKSGRWVDHRNFIMTGTSVYQIVTSLHIALCVMHLLISKAYQHSLTFQDKISLMSLPHIHLIVVTCFGLYEVSTVNAVDVGMQDIVAVRYILLLSANICCLLSELCYVLKDNYFGQIGWFLSSILIHRCYEGTLSSIQVEQSSGNCKKYAATVAFKTFMLKMVSLFSVLLFYMFIVGTAVASQNSFTHTLYNFSYLAFVLLIFEISLARFIFKALYSQQDLAVLAGLLLLISGHMFAYSRHISPQTANNNNNNNNSRHEDNNHLNITARFLEYCAQFIIATSVMKFEEKIYFKRIDYQ